MSFNVFNFMNNNSQLSANSNCEIFNFGKSSQMQIERSGCNSQNPNENLNNNQNFLFQNENDYNPENLLFQFNHSKNKNNDPTQSQKSNSNFFGNNNPDFFNFSQFHHQNQNFDQENNFNYMSGNYNAQINPDFGLSNRSSQIWQDNSNNLKANYQEAYNNNSNCSEMQIENSVRINENYNTTKKNSNNYLIGYQNNLASSKASAKSNKSLGFFKNNNTNKSPKHIVDSLKIINEAVENENFNDFGFLLQNQTPEKNKIINENAFENKFFLSNNKSLKEESIAASNHDTDCRQAVISDNSKANINSVKNNSDDKISLQMNSSSNLNSDLNNQIKAQSNLYVCNTNRINTQRAEKVLFRNKQNQIDLFASGNKFQEASEPEIKTDFIHSTNEAIKENKNNLQGNDTSNTMKNNLHIASEEIKAIKNIEIQKLCEDLDTLENDLFSTLTFKKRNFFDLGNPQSEEIMERIRLADIEELSKLLNYKGKEFKPDESNFHSVVNNNNKFVNITQGIKNRANDDIKEMTDAKAKEASENLLNEACKLQNGKTNENNNNYQKFFDSQLPLKKAKQANNLSCANANFNVNRKENALNHENNKYLIMDNKAPDKSPNNCQEKKVVRVRLDNNVNINKDIPLSKENLTENIPQAPSDNRILRENSIDSVSTDISSSIHINGKNQITKIKNPSNVKNCKNDEIKNNTAKCDKTSLFMIEEEGNGHSKIISQIQERKFKDAQLNSYQKQREIINIPTSSNNKIEKITNEDKKVNKFRYTPNEKKTTFAIDQVTTPDIETLKNSQIEVYNFNYDNVFAPMPDEEIEKLASSHTITSLSNIFEGKKSLVKYANDMMDNYCKLFMAVEKFRVNFKKYWETYMLKYLMDVEYYNFILGKINENHKYDLNKLEANVVKIAKKYQNDN